MYWKLTVSYCVLARAYDYGRKTQNDYEDEDDSLGMISGCDYFTRGEGSRNFTFGGRPIEERAARDEDDGTFRLLKLVIQ